LQVLVMSASKDMQGERIRLASDFWQAGISAEFTYKANPFMPEQMSHATSSGIPICIVLRPTELQEVCYLPAAQTGDLLNSRT
jgi:histidyl-tRNA synthetase